MIPFILQALFTADPIKHAYLQLSPSDPRIKVETAESSLKDYWRGASPAGNPKSIDCDWKQLHTPAIEPIDSGC